jgi:hypothetical protein
MAYKDMTVLIVDDFDYAAHCREVFATFSSNIIEARTARRQWGCSRPQIDIVSDWNAPDDRAGLLNTCEARMRQRIFRF